jgi:predicted AAA+ superfamily ATPase
MLKNRYFHNDIVADLKDKMVFIGGPRQVVKATLAKIIGEKNYKSPVYLNWDNRADRQAILGQKFPSEADLIIFDEIHKYKHWKNYIKGEYDRNKNRYDIIVTGSARLDIYRRGGDSLLGRYHYLRLHPFSQRELSGRPPDSSPELQFIKSDAKSYGIFSGLLEFGGFPEPILKKELRTLRRFHNNRLDRLVKEDIRDIENIRDLSAMQILADLLPGKVGSLLSLNNIKGDLHVNFKTVSKWMDILEKFYYHFRIYPYASSPIKSLRKEPKMYMWDWSQVESEPPRLENMAASHLLKYVHYLYDSQGYKAELNFLRDIEQRETDFLVSINKKPLFAVEVKLNDEKISKDLLYFRDRLKIPFVYQVIKEKNIDFMQAGARVISADKFLSGLV